MNYRLSHDISKALTHTIGGIQVANLSESEASQRISAHLLADWHLKIAFCNAHVVNVAAKQPALKEALDNFLVLPDGVGVDLACRYLHGRPFTANLNGTDFIPAFLRSCERPLTVSLLGAKPGVAERAADHLSLAFPRHNFTVAGDGYQTLAEITETLLWLEAARPDILLVALGNPRQELFIAHNITPRHAVVVAGVGALLDFLSGDVPRAPLVVRKARLEWIFRLLVEPRRLWKRYIFGNAQFFVRMLILPRERR